MSEIVLKFRKAALSMIDLSSRTVVIADQHPLWVDAMQNLLEGLGLTVVGRAGARDTALAAVEEHTPDLLVADLGTLADETSSSYSAIARAKQAHPSLICIVLAETADAVQRDRAFAVGATVFCTKSAEPDDLAVAVRQAFDHSIYFAVGGSSNYVVPEEETSTDESVNLTKREVEILRLAAEGYSNSQLARMLWVTEQTVKFHLSNIYRKLDVSNRTEASRWAQRNGLLKLDPVAA